jgi:hypothetical protein
MRAHIEPSVTFARTRYPVAEAGTVIKGWRDSIRSAPD